MSFGRYPEVTLAMARDRHVEARRLLANSVDPTAQREAAKTAAKIGAENSFQTIAHLWF